MIADDGQTESATRLHVRFVYGHGSGNVFPIVDARDLPALDADRWAALARLMADPAGPIGADGLLALGQGADDKDFSMSMRNVDGTEAETCLNGLRLVARAGFAAFGGERATVRLKTSTAEVAQAAPLAPGVVTIRETAGPALLDVADWPLTGEGHEIVERPIAALDPDRPFTAVAMPNPHLIHFTGAIDEAALVRIGTACEAAPGWLPNRANVSFVRQIDATTIFVRTHERGVGLTDSCGSAMAASVFVACLTGRCAFGATVTVRNKGGLVLGIAESDGMVTLHGNATYEWAGTVDVDLAAGTIGPVTVTKRFDDEIAAWARLVESANG